MTIKSGVSVDAQFVPTATGTLITPATDVTRSRITAANFFCTTGATLQVFLVPNGGSAGNDNQVIETVMVAGSSFDALELIGQSIESGGVLQANDGAAGGAAINFTATITEYSGDD